jgi:hypothetical protein
VTGQASASGRLQLVLLGEDESATRRLVKALERDGYRVSVGRARDPDAQRAILVVAGQTPDHSPRSAKEVEASGWHAVVLIGGEYVRPEAAASECIDLERWRGSRGNPEYRRLLSLLRDEPAGGAGPEALGRAVRARRGRVAALLGALAMGFSFSADLAGVQGGLCTIPISQPSWSDGCGALGLGGRPTRKERVAWESRPARDCAFLQDHIERFPDGAYRTVAADLWAARRLVPANTPERVSAIRQDYLRQSTQPRPSLAAARSDAYSRAKVQAGERTCAPVDRSERLLEAEVVRGEPSCASMGTGIVCALDYWAECQFERLGYVELCG